MLREWLDACEGTLGFEIDWINWSPSSPHLFHTTIRVHNGKALVEWVDAQGRNREQHASSPDELRALLREIASKCG